MKKLFLTVICLWMSTCNLFSQSTWTVSGNFTYFNASSTPMDVVKVVLKQGTSRVDSVMTDINGNYAFAAVANGIYKVLAYTTKPWNSVNATDAIKVQRHFAGLEIMTEPVKLQAADVNLSNSINATDAIKIKRRFSGMDSSFDRGDWTIARPTVGGDTVIVNGANAIQDFYVLCVGDVNGSNIPSPTQELPVIITGIITNISTNSATGGGSVFSDGGAAITSRGVCWSLSSSPAITDNHTSDGSGTGSFSSSLTGLMINTKYYVRAYATNSVGTVYGKEISFYTQAFSCGTSLTINHVAGSVAPVTKSVTYGVVTNIPGEPLKCWISSNLGADHQATAVNDSTEASAGWYWQFNRKQGYKYYGTTRTPNTTWINPINDNHDWQAANDPCALELGANWRIPVFTELMNLIYAGGWTDWNQAFNSGLKLHAAGDLSYTNGMLYTTRGKDGIYWSSTQYASYDTAIGQLIIISNSGVSGSYYRKSSGYSLRCIRENCTSGPNSPFSGTHIPFQTGIRWIWTQVNGATGYKWNISNDPASATDMDTVTAITETGLTCGTTYTRYVWAYNTCGNSTPLILNQATSACSDYCGLPVTDSRDGKSYNTILIGTQCWMAQNLNIGVRINGNQYQLNNGTIEKYCYNNLESMCDVYGGLYQWNELMNYTTSSNTNPSGRQGICMTGWHVPSESEWCQMETLMDPTVNCNSTDVTGTDAGGKMKETGITHWITPNTGAINTFGLSILPGGQVYPTSAFSNRGQYGYFWPATESSANGAGFYLVLYNTSQIARYTNKSKAYGMSARCVKD